MSYDIIGDIHGQSEKLELLLLALGYAPVDGVWQHPERKALFVGDFVDRGPGQIATLRIVRAMVEAGKAEAVMGNHEFNAIAWHTPDPLSPGQYLRKHTDKNRGQHQSFLDEVGEHTPEHDDWIQWFLQLPLWIEKEGLRVVHACWHPGHMKALEPSMGPNNTVPLALVEAASRKGSIEFESLEALCKGLEIDLPAPVTYTDAQGIVRDRTRVRWWDETATTYRAAALVGPRETEQLPDTIIPDEARVAYDQAKPVFFGHYWLTGTPAVISAKACCVDYSAARDGHPLVAYRWAGESELTNENLIAVLPGAIVRANYRH